MSPPRTNAAKEAERLFRAMRRDHEGVLARVGALERSLARRGGALARQRALAALVELLDAEFASHMAAEDTVLYPALLAALPAASGSIEPLFAEHAELRQILRRLEATVREPATADRDEQIRIQIRDLADLLRLHIRKEESLLFRFGPHLLTPNEIARVASMLSGRAPSRPSRPPRTRSKGVSR
jgi:hemerythrin-like domain-containing protein